MQLTTQDAALVVLALVADRCNGSSQPSVETLRTLWRDLGLRADDLIQGITLLTREGHAQAVVEGGTQLLLLSADCARELRHGEGFAQLPQHLQDLLAAAGHRNGDPSTPADAERRDGFH